MNRLTIRRALCNLIESPDDTINETEKRSTLLLKTGNEKYQQVALKLWSCLEEDDHDCNSLACKQCNRTREGANKRGNSSRLTQSFHFFSLSRSFLP